MSRQYLIPGQGYINEATNKDYLIPEYGYINETQGTVAPVTKAGTGGSISEFDISEAPISGSPSYVTIYNDSLTETATSSDSEIATLTASSILTENGTSSDSYIGSRATTDILTETGTSSDLYNGAQTVNGNMTEQIISTDAFVGAATDSLSLTENNSVSDSVILNNQTYNDFLTETVAANDNYIDANPLVVKTTITTGSGDDPWKKYLAWLQKKKRAEFKKKAANAGIKEVKAAQIADIAAQEIQKQEIGLKTPFYELIDHNEQEARHAAQEAIIGIYDEVWRQMAVQKRELADLGLDIQRQQEEDEEEFILMMM